MALVRGNPVLLVALFFGAAVLLMGGIYTLVPSVLKAPTPLSVMVLGALCVSLLFSIMIIGRVFWVVAKTTYAPRSVKPSEGK
jgi:vacuolar-type H+-ATPase subunit I/STV1